MRPDTESRTRSDAATNNVAELRWALKLLSAGPSNLGIELVMESSDDTVQILIDIRDQLAVSNQRLDASMR